MTYKTCTNCKRIFRTREEYVALTTHIGNQCWSLPNVADLELRNCVCKTTLATELPGENLRVLRALIDDARLPRQPRTMTMTELCVRGLRWPINDARAPRTVGPLFNERKKP